MGVQQIDPLSQLSLPPGFRFYPTDEELLVQYLCRKVAGQHFSLQIIGEIDLYKFDPWVLPSKAMFGEKEWYFFSPRDRKYPNGLRPNRVAGSGYWKATGTDKVITTEGRKVGIKKALVFYVGKAPKGTKTNWIMHEYRLIESSRKAGSSRLDDWVLCRIYKKNSSCQKPTTSTSSKEHSNNSLSSSSSHLDNVLESLPEINEQFFALPRANSFKTLQQDEKFNFQKLVSGNFDWASLAGLNSVPELGSIFNIQNYQTQPQSQRNLNLNLNSNGIYGQSIPALRQVDLPPAKFGNGMDEEVQSGLRSQGIESSGLFPQNSNGLTQNYSNSVDPSGFRYPTYTSGFRCRQ